MLKVSDCLLVVIGVLVLLALCGCGQSGSENANGGSAPRKVLKAWENIMGPKGSFAHPLGGSGSMVVDKLQNYVKLKDPGAPACDISFGNRGFFGRMNPTAKCTFKCGKNDYSLSESNAGKFVPELAGNMGYTNTISCLDAPYGPNAPTCHADPTACADPTQPYSKTWCQNDDQCDSKNCIWSGVWGHSSHCAPAVSASASVPGVSAAVPRGSVPMAHAASVPRGSVPMAHPAAAAGGLVPMAHPTYPAAAAGGVPMANTTCEAHTAHAAHAAHVAHAACGVPSGLIKAPRGSGQGQHLIPALGASNARAMASAPMVGR